MILDATLVLIWCAAAYRAWMLVRHERTVWRTSFTLSLTCAAVAITMYRVRDHLDALTGAWNLTTMVSHLALTAGLTFLLVYLDALRMPVVSTRRILVHAIIGAAVLVTIVTSWFAAPVHDQPHGDLRGVAGWAAAVYCLVFWAYLAAGLLGMGWTCLAQGRTFRRHDPARSVTLLVIGLSAFAALPVVVLWTVSLLVRGRPGVDAEAYGTLADQLMPWPLAFNSLGVLSLLVVPYVTGLATAWRRSRRLRPLWADLIRRHPEVHLDIVASGGPLARAQTRNERLLIEIHDALRKTPVDLDPPATDHPIAAVGAALRRSSGGQGLRAAELVPRADDRDDDIRQVVALADAYRAAKDAA